MFKNVHKNLVVTTLLGQTQPLLRIARLIGGPGGVGCIFNQGTPKKINGPATLVELLLIAPDDLRGKKILARLPQDPFLHRIPLGKFQAISQY